MQDLLRSIVVFVGAKPDGLVVILDGLDLHLMIVIHLLGNSLADIEVGQFETMGFPSKNKMRSIRCSA